MLRPLAMTVGAAASGIIWRWSEEYRSGERFTWRRILFDLASSVGIGLSAWSVTGWLDLPEAASVAIACGVGTLGRNGVIELVLRWRGLLDNNRKGKGDEK